MNQLSCQFVNSVKPLFMHVNKVGAVVSFLSSFKVKYILIHT